MNPKPSLKFNLNIKPSPPVPLLIKTGPTEKERLSLLRYVR